MPSLKVATPEKQINSFDADIHMQESLPHKRLFLVGGSSPSKRLAKHFTFRFALGPSSVCLVGENLLRAPSRHCRDGAGPWPYHYGHARHEYLSLIHI